MNKSFSSLLCIGLLFSAHRGFAAKEESHADCEFKKKQMKAAETIDKAITAALLVSLGYTALNQANISNKIPAFLKKHTDQIPTPAGTILQPVHKHNKEISAALLCAKLGWTLRRMSLYDRFSWNPFKILYFIGTDMISWIPL